MTKKPCIFRFEGKWYCKAVSPVWVIGHGTTPLLAWVDWACKQ